MDDSEIQKPPADPAADKSASAAATPQTEAELGAGAKPAQGKASKTTKETPKRPSVKNAPVKRAVLAPDEKGESAAAESEEKVLAEDGADGLAPEPLAEMATAAPAEKAPEPSDVKRKKRRKIRWRRVVATTAIVVAFVLVIGLAVFLAFRWGFSDDVAQIQGQWRIDGSNAVITITEDQIVLSDDLTFTYELDPFAKTIRFRFTDLDGNGHYRFSLDGNRLAIQDGTVSAWDTLVRDVPMSFGLLVDLLTGNATPLFGEGSDVTNLTRVEPGSVTAPTPAPEATQEPSESGDESAQPPAEETPEPEPAPPPESLGQDPEAEAGTGAL